MAEPMEPLEVWRFYDAPEEYQKLSGHGGDEDWIVRAPAVRRTEFEWLCETLEVCDYQTEEIIEDDTEMLIGITSHA